MEELRNLRQIYDLAVDGFSTYNGRDFVLPQAFKDVVSDINNNTISYNMYSAIIETKGVQNGVLNIYLPNQWFYIASYFTDFYNELQYYKKIALAVLSKERLKELNGKALTKEEETLVDKLPLSEVSKSYLTKFVTDYSWWGGAKTIDRGDFYVSPILSAAKLVNASQSFVADLCAFLSNRPDMVGLLVAAGNKVEQDVSSTYQQIYYGAPGTGKSHKIKSEVDEKNKICYRTTFHPDSDYSTFVGAYKPSMKPTGTILASGEKEEIIKYTFVPQAFTKAYVHAWNTKDEVYLVIEEINRGNCAQIFGDLFQLLDRKNGFSEYPIDADSDLEDHIKEKLETSTRDDIPEQVRAGKKLMLPSNLYIWATMNTSDQSLFPIDSAFKRRWDWVYTPIKQHDGEYKIVIGDDAEYDWWGFLEKINQVIDDATSSEDKKLGYFFVKAQDKVISPEKFVGKVLFYLWNDVFKNYGFDSPIFSKGENKKFTFSDFFTGSGEPDTEMVKSFLKKLDETIDKDKPFTIDKSEVAVNPEEVTEPA